MNFKRPAYYSRIYRDFEEIRGQSFDSVIAFYERHRTEIKYLPFSEQFDLRCEYADALFEKGAYRQHIEEADKIIEDSIYHNIKYFHGRDIYIDALFKKAASKFNLNETTQAINILKDLRKIEPQNRDFFLFLYRCHLKKRPSWLNRTRAIFILLVLLAALIIGAELFIVRPYFPSATFAVELGRNIIFMTALGILIIGEGYHLTNSYFKSLDKN